MTEEKREQSELTDHSYDPTIRFRKMLSTRHRAGEAAATSLLWMIYGYLWLPLVSLIAWYYGIDFAFDMVIKAGGPDALIVLLIQLGLTFLATLLVIISWSSFQYSKFKGTNERRSRTSELNADEERELWQISEALQAQIKSSKVQTISLGTDGRIKSVV